MLIDVPLLHGGVIWIQGPMIYCRAATNRNGEQEFFVCNVLTDLQWQITEDVFTETLLKIQKVVN